ncbi:MAG: glycosyltransferase family 39 protein [Candidatus Wallbacteria bacterium]|nr:glycosyltransferase family 39 protein [Candidatus Wallbacteria bacterium]
MSASPHPTPSGNPKALLALAAAAFLLRLALLTWGLPLGPERAWLHPDEHGVLNHARQFPLSLVFNPEPQYPSGLGVLMRAGMPAPALALSGMEPLLSRESWDLALTLWGRLLTILLAATLPWSVWRLTRSVADDCAAWTAATIATFTVWSADHACFLTGDAAASALFGLATWALVELVEHPSRAGSFVAGLAAGAAGSIKYVAALPLLPAVGLLARRRLAARAAGDRPGGRARGTELAMLAEGALVAVLMLQPALLVNAQLTLSVLSREGAIIANHAAMPLRLYAEFVAGTTWWLVGPAALLLPVGCLRLARRGGAGWLLLAMPVLFFVAVRGFYERHMVFVLPVLASIAGVAVQSRDPRPWRTAAALMLVLQCAVTTFTVGQRVCDVRQSPRFQRQLESLIPDNARVWASSGFPSLPGRHVVATGVGDRPDFLLLDSYFEKTYRDAVFVYRDERTGTVPPKYRWAFFRGTPPEPAELETFSRLFGPPESSDYAEIARFDQPGSDWLQWFLEFFPYRLRVFARKGSR